MLTPTVTKNESGSILVWLVGLIVWIAIFLLAWNYVVVPVWGYFFKDYSKPWWNGTATQRVCDAFDASKCYTLSVRSDGEYIRQVYFPNGGYIVPASSSCAELHGGGRFCTFFEANGKEWDVFPY